LKHKILWVGAFIAATIYLISRIRKSAQQKEGLNSGSPSPFDFQEEASEGF